MGSSKHDPAEYIVPPQLEKGHSEKIQCYVQSGHVRALNVIARSGVFPFEEKNDVVRWCVKFGLEELDRREIRLINSVMRRTNLLIAMAQEDIERLKFLEAFDKLRTVVSGHMGRNDRAMARDMVIRYREQIEKMPDEPERELRWKIKYLDELDTFKYLEAVE
jgi:hypothetical protein